HHGEAAAVLGAGAARSRVGPRRRTRGVRRAREWKLDPAVWRGWGLSRRRARDWTLDFDVGGNATTSDVRGLLHSDDLFADERAIHTGRQHAALGPTAFRAQSGSAFRDDRSRDSHQGCWAG